MPRALLFYEWIVWFKDGHHITQHDTEGAEIMWTEVQEYHENTSPAKRAGWLPFDELRAQLANAKYGGQQCVHDPALRAHFIEPVNDELPFMRRRMEYSWRGSNQESQIYFYIMGSGGRQVFDSRGGVSYEDGYYIAIDMHGNTRSDHRSNVTVPVIPPEKGDKIENAETESETIGT